MAFVDGSLKSRPSLKSFTPFPFASLTKMASPSSAMVFKGALWRDFPHPSKLFGWQGAHASDPAYPGAAATPPPRGGGGGGRKGGAPLSGPRRRRSRTYLPVPPSCPTFRTRRGRRPGKRLFPELRGMLLPVSWIEPPWDGFR